jgi:hypothetical protein
MNSADIDTLSGFITELANSMTRVDAEKDLQKDILGRAQEELGLKKTLVNKLANIYHNQTIDRVVAEREELEDLYNSLFPSDV